MDISRKMTLADLLEAVPNAGELTVEEAWALVRKHESGDAALSDAMTLTEFYEQCYRPEVSDGKDLKRSTYRQRERALRLWEKHTGNPALCDIDKKTMVQFVKKMREEKRPDGLPISPATIKKHCAALRSVLDYAGPKTEKQRDAKRLIPMPPAWPRVRVFRNVTSRTPTRKEVEALIGATDSATLPRLPGISAPDWWRCVYTFLALTGIRKSDLFGIRWRDVREWEGMECVVIPAEVEKTGVEKIIPLSSAARAVLEEMPHNGEDTLIFEFPHCDTTFYRQRRRIIRAAGVSVERRRGTFHGVRRYVGTHVSDATLVLGHTTPEMTREHYQSMERAAMALEAHGSAFCKALKLTGQST